MPRKDISLVVFRQNLLKLFVGILLLILSFHYLQTHAAEKTSLVSGLDIMAQRVHVLSYKILGKDFSSLEEKYLIVRRLEEVVYTASYLDSCDGSLYIEELREKIDEIRQSVVDEDFRRRLPFFFSYLFEAQDFVVNECQELQG